MTKSTTVSRALLSVSDKSGVVGLARELSALGVELLSTGGTASLLRQQQLSVIDVSDYTGFPEIMGGRVKTLHPKILGGVLGRRDIDTQIMQKMQIPAIDLVVINLYPFAETTCNPDHTLVQAIENIDIGGPNLLRAAAKNVFHVTVLTDIADYPAVINELHEHQCISYALRLKLARKAFQCIASYDQMIADYFCTLDPEQRPDEQPTQTAATISTENPGTDNRPFPEIFSCRLNKKFDCRYGENPHQRGAVYVEENPAPGTIACAQQKQGKVLSFNNIMDSDTALECVNCFTEPACVIVKHANPCGVALGVDLDEAYEHAYAADPISAFGGIIALNRTLNEKLAASILARQFVEVIVAPDFTAAALDILAAKPNIRLLACGLSSHQHGCLDYKRIRSGLLLQDIDNKRLDETNLTVVSQRQPNAEELRDCRFAWITARFVKSNAIVYAKDNRTVGIGAGQMSRVDSARVAAMKAADAKLTVTGSVMASDAFFPFRDSIDAAAAIGISAIIQPGGSIRDFEIIAAADEANIAMLFTGIRHFRH